MSEHNSGGHQQHLDDNEKTLDTHTKFEARISRLLHEQASHVHFRPAFRERIIQQITLHKPDTAPKGRRIAAPAFVLIATCIIVLTLTTYLFQAFQPHYPSLTTTLHYTTTQAFTAPDALAKNGRILSLDPTGQHLVYASANEQGVMYTADVNNPVQSNLLAMRYAHDTSWAPDGSALVTTVSPAGFVAPLLTIVQAGHYMNLLGHEALAAVWSPVSTQQIIFATQSNGTTSLWETPPIAGKTPQLIATLPLNEPVQHLRLSQNGQMLALVVATSNTNTSSNAHAVNQQGRAVYIMDMQTKTLQTVIEVNDSTIGNAAWSPDGHYLTYEQTDTRGYTTLHIFDVSKHQKTFTLTPLQALLGWSWSPASNALLYSDGGVLHAYVLHGSKITFAATKSVQAYPLWRADGRILCMDITKGIGKLVLLTSSTK